VGGVLGGPDDFAAVVGEFLWCAKVIELVVERAGLARAFAVEHGQRAERAGFVDIAAVMFMAAFRDQVIALPEKFGGFAIDGFRDSAAESVVAITGAAAIRKRDAD